MTVSFEIEEINNGFVVTCYDRKGKAKNDVKTYVTNFDQVLDSMDNWFTPIEKERKKEGSVVSTEDSS